MHTTLQNVSCNTPADPRGQPWISPYRDPRISVFLACVTTECQGVWFCCQPLVDPSSSLMQIYFLSSCFPHISEVLACHFAKFQNQSKFQDASPAALLKTQNMALGFCVLTLLRKKYAVGGSLGLMTAQFFLSVCLCSFSSFFSRSCFNLLVKPLWFIRGVQWQQQNFSTV